MNGDSPRSQTLLAECTAVAAPATFPLFVHGKYTLIHDPPFPPVKSKRQPTDGSDPSHANLSRTGDWNNPVKDHGLGHVAQQGGYGTYWVGKQTNDDHGAVIRTELDFADVDIQFDFRFSGGKSFNFVIDDQNEPSVHSGHICRVSLSPQRLKISDDKTGSPNLQVRELRQDKNLSTADSESLQETMARTQSAVKVDLPPGEWLTLRVRIRGDNMKAFLDDQLATSLRTSGSELQCISFTVDELGEFKQLFGVNTVS